MKKQISLSESFMLSWFKLNSQDRKSTLTTLRQIQDNPETPSLHMHSIDREKCDKRLLSARVTRDIRAILYKEGDTCSMLYVDHHDAAYDWCEGKYLAKTGFGEFFLFDGKVEEEKLAAFIGQEEVPDYLGGMQDESLFEKAGVKAKDLEKLGIKKEHIENLMNISDEGELLDYIEFLPQELQEALIDIGSGNKSYDVAYNELFNPDTNNGAVNGRKTYLTDDLSELEALIENESYEKWVLFLHPSQEALIKKNYNGPVLVEGGPGTGKTIVGIHRAVYLAQNVYKADEGKKILVCTFSKRLAASIEKKIEMLCKIKGVKNNILTMSVDSYINRLVGDRHMNVDVKQVQEILVETFKESKWDRSLDFFIYEYYEIVEKNNISSEEEYLYVRRTGAGEALSKSQRQKIWPFFETVLRRKKERNAYSFIDRAYLAASMLENGEAEKEFDSVIIDEAQDLEGIKIKVICDSIMNEKNNAFILSDQNQRIFKLNTWAKDAGIEVVGRTFYLRINYRTTKQINDYARNQFSMFDDSRPCDKEYISIMSGVEPDIIKCKDKAEELRAIVKKVNELTCGYAPGEICVLAPTYEVLREIAGVLSYELVEAEIISADNINDDSKGILKLCTTSGVKGLEFPVVIIAEFNKIGTQKSIYENSAEVDLDYEKLVECEKYVAITRARDIVVITYTGE